MPYRMGRGDYYRGDYYRGGLLSGLGSMLKGGIKTGIGFLTGGPVGAARALATHARSEIAPSGQSTAIAPIGSSSAATPTSMIVAPQRDIVHVAHEQASIAKAKTGGRITAAQAGQLAAGSVGRTMGGGLAGLGAGMHGGFRRRGRMNVLNSKALNRALRRANGFAKYAMKAIKLIHPAKKVKFGGFKKRRK